jgi:hypothetical protein
LLPVALPVALSVALPVALPVRLPVALPVEGLLSGPVGVMSCELSERSSSRHGVGAARTADKSMSSRQCPSTAGCQCPTHCGSTCASCEVGR